MKLFILAFAFPVAALAVVPLPQRFAKPLVAAHQGGGRSERPNTLAQFDSALKDGADVIETDLRLSSDKVPVVFHDESLHKHTHCSGDLNSKTWSEIQHCQFKNNAEPISSFEQLLQKSQGRFLINAEFKTDEVVGPALALIKKYNAHDWVFFQTQGNRQRYALARSLDKDAYLLYAPDNKKDIEWIEGLNDKRLLIVELHPKFNDKAIIESLHKHGKFVTEDAFYVSKDEEATTAGCELLFELGFDMAVTDQTKSCAIQRNNFVNHK